MSASCGHHHRDIHEGDHDPAYRRVLVAALAANLAMFLIETVSGAKAGSLALIADAVDFLGDSATYAITLFVLPYGLRVRARGAQIKGASMALFGLAIALAALGRALSGTPPEADVMGFVGALALATNVAVAMLLMRHRGGDANRRAVWLCSRNDALGNVAVVGAAGLVAFTGSRWPDLLVAVGMAGLALSGGVSVLRQAQGEIARSAKPAIGGAPQARSEASARDGGKAA